MKDLLTELLKSEMKNDCWIKITVGKFDSKGAEQRELEDFTSDASLLSEYEDYLHYEETKMMKMLYPLNESIHSLVFVAKINDEDGNEKYIAVSGAFRPILVQAQKKANPAVSPLENLLKTLVSFTKNQAKANKIN